MLSILHSELYTILNEKRQLHSPKQVIDVNRAPFMSFTKIPQTLKADRINEHRKLGKTSDNPTIIKLHDTIQNASGELQ